MHPARVFCIALAAPALAQGLPPEKLLARLPDGIELEGRPERSPDGTEVPNVSRPVFSPDGTAVAYVGHKGGKEFPVVGEAVGDAFHYLEPPVFGATGATVAFRAGNNTGPKTESWWLWIDGKKQRHEDWIGALACSADGSQWAYWTQPGARIDPSGAYARKDVVLVVGKKKSKKYDDADALTAPAFSPDGKQVASAVQQGNLWFVLVFGAKEELRGGGAPMIDTIVWRPDGKELAVVEMDPGRGAGGPAMPWTNLVVRVGKQVFGKEYDTAGMPVFSRDGKRLAYKVVRGDRMGVAVDGDAKAATEWAFVDEVAFSPDGKHLAYTATKDGKPANPGDLSHFARWQVKGGAWQIVLDGKAGDAFDAIEHVTFAPDGKQLAYAGRKDGSWRIVAGGTRSEAFDDLGSLRFRDDGKRIGFGARLGRELWWKHLELP